MLSLDDERWESLKGGYQMPFDHRPAIAMLTPQTNRSEAWEELWENLHHQGDLGEASYASVPHLVRIYRESSEIDWNAYAMVAVIEVARTETKNPPIPDFLHNAYYQAIQDLAELGAKQISQTKDPETVRNP